MTSRLLRSTGTVGGGTLASRVLGFVRDVVIARVFGASLGADAFFVAFKLPNFLRRLFAEGAFSQSFVPVLSEWKTVRSPGELRDFVAHVTGALGCVVSLVTILGVLTAPVLVYVFAPGFADEPEKYALTVSMLRWTFPYLLFISLTALSTGILNAHGAFAVPAYTPVLLNLCLIAGAVWVAPLSDPAVMALAWAVFAAGAAQLAFQLPFVARLGLLVPPRLSWRHPGVRQIFRLIGPAAFGASVVQINLLVDTMLASFLVTGSVTWLYLSDRMVEFPLGVFAIALATVILPSLSTLHAQGLGQRFSDTVDWALRWAVLIGGPSALGLGILALPILSTLFQYGAFTDHDVIMAGRSLMAYATGLLGFVLIKMLAPAFFSRQDTRTPVRIGIIALGVTLVLNVILVFPLKHAGLALATALGAWVNAGLLLRQLRREGVYRPNPGWRRIGFAALVANGAMSVVLFAARGEAADWFVATGPQRIGALSALVLGGAAIYGLALWVCGLRPRHLQGD